MSHFYASINGSAKSEATRQGTKKTGIKGHIRGWKSGVKVYGLYDITRECDEFQIYATIGSNENGHDIFLGAVVQTPTGVEFKLSEEE